MIYLKLYRIFRHFLKYHFRKQFKNIIEKMLLQLPGEFLNLIWNLSFKYIPNSKWFVHFSKLWKKMFKLKTKFENIYIDFQKSTNLFEMKKISSLIALMLNFLLYRIKLFINRPVFFQLRKNSFMTKWFFTSICIKKIILYKFTF